MNRHDLHEIARAVRQQDGQLVIKPQITSRQIRSMAALEAIVALQQPVSETAMGDPATGKIRFAWGLFGFPPTEDVDWIMT